MDEILEKKHAILVTEFDRYVVEHPEFAAGIPRNAQIVLQVEHDEDYNQWSEDLAQRQREQGHEFRGRLTYFRQLSSKISKVSPDYRIIEIRPPASPERAVEWG